MTSTKSRAKHRDIREPLTNRIRGILDEYPDGTQIARELLQNSDDARSKIQWYLLDHHDYRVNKPKDQDAASASSEQSPLKLLDPDMDEYMGPALLSGSDSMFEEKDFKSMMNLAASEKRNDETKIGQMGIGFNSIYHLTDCPSFITGSDLMVIDPHERILDGRNRDLPPRSASYNFVEDRWGLEYIPDQLKAFSVLEDIDFSKPYEGTIFRFPLRTKEQAKNSLLSKKAYTTEKVLEMLLKLRDEALRGILFLKHVERIIIYERKALDKTPKKLFEIEILNAEEVRKKRLQLLSKLRSHVNAEEDEDTEATLEYSIQPVYRLTQADGSITDEAWHITTFIGNVVKAHQHMTEQTGGDLSTHKLIPWVGIAAPSMPGVKVDGPRLFCFLPIGISLPFPVHINGHFAVKQSRREIWTNQDNDFAKDASANIKSEWNIHLFEAHVPVVYAKFLADLGLARGPNYSLWPTSCGEGLGVDMLWKDLLSNVLRVVCKEDLAVFFCGSETSNDQRLVSYSSSWIAGRDLDCHPHLLKALQELDEIVVDLPDPILEELQEVIEDLDLEDRILTPELVRVLLRDTKKRWSSSTSNETRIDMLTYCIQDGEIADLEGLPLLPMAGDTWVEFCSDERDCRYITSPKIFKVLEHSNEGLVDIDIDADLVESFRNEEGFSAFWCNLQIPDLAARIRDLFFAFVYSGRSIPVNVIDQTEEDFPTAQWIKDFWEMVCSFKEGSSLLSRLDGLHLLPITRGRLSPLSKSFPVAYLDQSDLSKEPTLQSFIDVLDKQLDYRVLREGFMRHEGIAGDYVFDVSNASMVLEIVPKISEAKLKGLPQADCQVICNYIARWLSTEVGLHIEQRKALMSLPIFQTYDMSSLVPLQGTGTMERSWRVAYRFSHSEYPWQPRSIQLLADEQPLLHHLTKLLQIIPIKESDYWYHHILSNLDQYEDEWDPIMHKFYGMYHIHSKDYNFVSLLQDVPFVRVSGPKMAEENGSSKRLSPRYVVDPSLSEYFLDDEILFPIGQYAPPGAIFSALKESSIRSKFDASFVVERISTLSARTKSSGVETCRPVLVHLYSQLNVNFSEQFWSSDLQTVLKTTPWILAGIDGDKQCELYSPAECRPMSDQSLVGSKMPLAMFTFTNQALIKRMGWDTPAPLNKVLEHFISLLDAPLAISESEINSIYNYLQEKVNSPNELSYMKAALNSKPWIRINGAFYTTEKAVFTMDFKLEPYFVQVNQSNLARLFRAMGVQECLGMRDLRTVMSKIASEYKDDEELHKDDIDLLVKLLDAIAFHKDFNYSSDLWVPTSENRLCQITEIVFDNVSFRRTNSSIFENGELFKYTFANNRISLSLAEKLQLPMFSSKAWEDQRDISFQPWAQEEDILDRIKNILNDYDPANIFTEFLQNAADAGATKCTFMLDQRSYGKESLLEKEMSAWQGPALVIYNDAEFKEDDFQALCKLGLGNKRDDPSKIGRHGLGFNSVYHFTDVPSVLSGSHIVFFDPKKKYLPKSHTSRGLVAHGGQRCNFLELKGDTYADQWKPYKGLFGCDMKSHFPGTIFRIPLRTFGNQNSLTQDTRIGSEWTIIQVMDMLRSWQEDASIGMLFLKNMKEIELKDSNDDYAWCVTKEDDIPNSKNVLRPEGGSSSTTQIVDIITKGLPSNAKEPQKWLIHVDSEFPENTNDPVKEQARANKWSSERGIAIPLYNDFRSPLNEGRLFTHLPTSITTGLKFHIHGVFALTSNRKNLAGGSDKSNPQASWNNFMMNECLPLTTARAFKNLHRWTFRAIGRGPSKGRGIELNVHSYFGLWPTKGKDNVESFIGIFSRLAYDQQIFPCTKDGRVIALTGEDVVFPGLAGAFPEVRQWVHDVIYSKGVHICEISPLILQSIKKHWKAEPPLPFTVIDEDYVRRLIREDPTFVPEKMKKPEARRWILQYTLSAILEPKRDIQEPINGLALLPLVNGSWVPLSPSPVRYVTKPEVRKLINGGDLLVDESWFQESISRNLSVDGYGTKGLEDILTRLIEDRTYGLEQLPPNKFASIFCAEHPNGVPEDKHDNLWRYLGLHSDLDAFGDIPILRMLNGTMKPLKQCKVSFETSKADSEVKVNLQKLGPLLLDLAFGVFSADDNRRHPYFTQASLKASNEEILKCIARRCANWPGRSITKVEAAVIRSMLGRMNDGFKEYAEPLGILQIWPSLTVSSSQEQPLICARGSYFLGRGCDLANLGQYPDIINSDYCKMFAAMGAQCLNLVSAAESKVLPKFINGTLSCQGYGKVAYFNMLNKIISKSTSNSKGSNEAKRFLLWSRCIVARDGSFKVSSNLYDPDDLLVSTVFEGEQSLFPSQEIWAIIQNKKQLFSFRNSNDSTVVRECASHVLDLIRSEAPNVRSKAVQLVHFIYNNCGNSSCRNINWMDPQWQIVPAEVMQDEPYNEFKPKLSAYLPFCKVVDPKWREVCWTQCAFFPQSLKPSSTFKQCYPSVGDFDITQIVHHLSMLSQKVALTWKSTDKQLKLKLSLFKIYDTLQSVAEQSEEERKALSRALSNMKGPYILNGNDKDPSRPESWLWPKHLMLDIENNTGHFSAVHPSMEAYREFLVTAGALQMENVEGSVEVPKGRRPGEIEERLFNCWVSQDRHNGFMDVRFVFSDNQEILAHKFMLVHTNEYFARRFTGTWAQYSTRDPSDLGVEIINMSEEQESFEAFWGLIHFLYTDQLIRTDERPVLNDARAIPESEDAISMRGEFLMDLLQWANQYDAPRLKALIADEIVSTKGFVVHGNVFEIREHAKLYQSKDIQDYCEEFLRRNAFSVREYLNNVLRESREELKKLTGKNHGAERADLKQKIENVESYLRDLAMINA
ncbi:hypothetical protein BX616_008570 [Lobosporangium transversale]|uniref:BTB domain-containing protein n=1 Tax=Lobosporangium transversale TaxID=64571 RepID=A0A1Y2H0J1_9FUNG|nr:hypothetical protein BCR41DRAFT_418994 [Lobosporangium transversale]KAF9918470.1 hypothetical protein BX616_008570 [Lobosporangium transversale]ORZ28035.1 hypothetical protein BCR41DRAFT_418994 [Lobosporangium transversale]|eukprot:XP_021885738.1 hypothetical protein BCR41DRAFT_418994 [Lobosporangium transversale]